MKIYRLLLLFSLTCLPVQPAIAQSDAVLIGFDGAFGLANATSATAIERGILIAIDEINRSGGVLDGRPLKLVSRDNRSVTARGIRNLKNFNEMPDMVAMFVGRFSPVALESIGLAHKMKMILLDPWAAADAIIDNGFHPNYAFRLSLKDSLAMPAMFQHALDKDIRRIALLLPNTSWGRSNLNAADRYQLGSRLPQIAGMEWYPAATIPETAQGRCRSYHLRLQRQRSGYPRPGSGFIAVGSAYTDNQSLGRYRRNIREPGKRRAG